MRIVREALDALLDCEIAHVVASCGMFLKNDWTLGALHAELRKRCLAEGDNEVIAYVLKVTSRAEKETKVMPESEECGEEIAEGVVESESADEVMDNILDEAEKKRKEKGGVPPVCGKRVSPESVHDSVRGPRMRMELQPHTRQAGTVIGCEAQPPTTCETTCAETTPSRQTAVRDVIVEISPESRALGATVLRGAHRMIQTSERALRQDIETLTAVVTSMRAEITLLRDVLIAFHEHFSANLVNLSHDGTTPTHVHSERQPTPDLHESAPRPSPRFPPPQSSSPLPPPLPPSLTRDPLRTLFLAAQHTNMTG